MQYRRRIKMRRRLGKQRDTFFMRRDILVVIPDEMQAGIVIAKCRLKIRLCGANHMAAFFMFDGKAFMHGSSDTPFTAPVLPINLDTADSNQEIVVINSGGDHAMPPVTHHLILTRLTCGKNHDSSLLIQKRRRRDRQAFLHCYCGVMPAALITFA